MSIAFEMLSAALNEAIADVQTQHLPRRTVTLKLNPLKIRPLRRFNRTCAVKRHRKITANN